MPVARPGGAPIQAAKPFFCAVLSARHKKTGLKENPFSARTFKPIKSG